MSLPSTTLQKGVSKTHYHHHGEREGKLVLGFASLGDQMTQKTVACDEGEDTEEEKVTKGGEHVQLEPVEEVESKDAYTSGEVARGDVD